MVDPQTMLRRYQTAKSLEQEWRAESMTVNSYIFPNWIKCSSCFWYIRRGRSAQGITKSFRLVDAVAGTNTTAFDHDGLAISLSRASGENVDPRRLPFNDICILVDQRSVMFSAFGKNWRYDAGADACLEEPSSNPENWLISPDGSMAAYVREYNVFVRCLKSGDERALTSDGVLHNAYAVIPERESQIKVHTGIGLFSGKPEALWSPDSSRLLIIKTDERQVRSLPITKYVPEENGPRPICKQTKYALPGDEHIACYRLVSINVTTGEKNWADYPAILDSVVFLPPIMGNRVWWGGNSNLAYFVDVSRGQRNAKVVSFDVYSGQTQVLIEESAETYIDLALEFEKPAYLRYLATSEELIWFSERSGWGHLYLYDLRTGNLTRPLTQGEWLVRDILRVDAERREIFALVAGRECTRDPYYKELVRIDIDSGEIVSLMGGDFDCTVWKGVGFMDSFFNGIAPTGDFLVVTQSRIDQPSQTWLLSRDGERLLLLETADLSGLPTGWQWPEPVTLKSADGKTNIYGVIFRPSHFDSNKSYPILDWAGTNPFYARVPKAFTSIGYYPMAAMALAELGFIVVMIDGRGSCYRSKKFHDHSYGQLHKGSDLRDHVAGISQLAERYPSMDRERVGIVDVQGSNAPAYGLLAFPDFYKVGAMVSMWDPRLLTQGEIYQGPDGDYDISVLGNLADKLEGKLFVGHGIMDAFFHVCGLMQFLDAITNANKDIDLMIVPNGGHSIHPVGHMNTYMLRRIWDYLVLYLLNETPPKGFNI